MRSPYKFACVCCAARRIPNCSASKLRDGKQAMLYKYDQLNRITKSRSLAFGNNAYAARSGDQKYDEDYSYDANGNILTLNRKDDKAAVMDDFNYSYYANSNKLLKHKTAGGAYEYDAIGNLVKDNNEGLTITWTPSGKVRSVVKPDTTIYFRYDAMGNRIAKIVSTASKNDTTAYVRDASGNVMTIYNNRTAGEVPIYGSGRIGEYMGKEKEGYQTFNLRKYELTNHLGNVLAVISDKVNLYGHNNILDSARATVMSASDYYPFGLPMKGRQFNEKNFRYGFNGKENDNEFGWQDYGMRMYMRRIARFPSPDPITAKYPMLTPFQFASNSPISGIDLDGLEYFNMTTIRAVSLGSAALGLGYGVSGTVKQQGTAIDMIGVTHFKGHGLVLPKDQGLNDYKETKPKVILGAELSVTDASINLVAEPIFAYAKNAFSTSIPAINIKGGIGLGISFGKGSFGVSAGLGLGASLKTGEQTTITESISVTNKEENGILPIKWNVRGIEYGEIIDEKIMAIRGQLYTGDVNTGITVTSSAINDDATERKPPQENTRGDWKSIDYSKEEKKYRGD